GGGGPGRREFCNRGTCSGYHSDGEIKQGGVMAQLVVNPAKELLVQGKLAIGIGVRAFRVVEVARIMKTAGFDWLFIDLEHGATSVETAYTISVSALDAEIAPLVR